METEIMLKLLLDRHIEDMNDSQTIEYYDKLISFRKTKNVELEQQKNKLILQTSGSIFLHTWQNLEDFKRLKINKHIPFLYKYLQPINNNNLETSPLILACVAAKITTSEEIRSGVSKELELLLKINSGYHEETLKKVLELAGQSVVRPLILDLMYNDKLGGQKNLKISTIKKYISDNEINNFFLKDECKHLRIFLNNQLKANGYWDIEHLPEDTITNSLKLCCEHLKNVEKDYINELSGDYLNFIEVNEKFLTHENVRPLIEVGITDSYVLEHLKILQLHFGIETKDLDTRDIKQFNVGLALGYDPVVAEKLWAKIQVLQGAQNSKESTQELTIC